MAEKKKYDIFISWSNDAWKVHDQWNYVDEHEQRTVSVGALIAAALRHYLEVVLESKEVYFSRDVKSGVWETQLFDALKTCKLGIFVATEPFLDSMWCNLEFGASKMIADKIIVFKITGNSSYDRNESLVAENHYQLTEFDTDGIKELLKQLKECFSLGDSFKIEKKLLIWKAYEENIKTILQNINTPYTRTYKLRQQFSALEKDKYEELERIKKEKEDEVRRLKADLDAYKTADIDELQSRVSHLTSKIDDMEKTNKSLFDDKQVLFVENQNLAHNLTEKESIIKVNEKELRRLKSDNEDLREKLREKEQELESLRKPSLVEDGSDDLVIQLKGGVSFVMKRVKGGTFQMGSNDGNDNEKPIHSVTLSDYYIGETQVTQELWVAIMGDNPSYKERGLGKNLPVNNITWDCIVNVFLPKLNKATGRNFRLPTEAEWEYAARGGEYGYYNYYKFSGSDDIDEVAWYNGNSKGKVHPVKIEEKTSPEYKKPNELGIYGMSGNVWEWCQDWIGDYNSEPQTDPQGPSSGSLRVLRGGSWYFSANHCRVSRHLGSSPDDRDSDSGLRLALPCSPFPS